MLVGMGMPVAMTMPLVVVVCSEKDEPPLLEVLLITDVVLFPELTPLGPIDNG